MFLNKKKKERKKLNGDREMHFFVFCFCSLLTFEPFLMDAWLFISECKPYI